MFIQFNPEKYIFNLGDWVEPSDQKEKGLGKNHCENIMADEEDFDVGRDLPAFLAFLFL